MKISIAQNINMNSTTLSKRFLRIRSLCAFVVKFFLPQRTQGKLDEKYASIAIVSAQIKAL